MQLIHDHIEEVKQACSNAHVESLFAFGSILTDHFSEESDIDFIVSIDLEDPLEYGESYFQLKFDLEKIFKRDIDLLEQKAIRNELFQKKIDEQKALVYARGSRALA